MGLNLRMRNDKSFFILVSGVSFLLYVNTYFLELKFVKTVHIMLIVKNDLEKIDFLLNFTERNLLRKLKPLIRLMVKLRYKPKCI
jgi:hypothetical protein